MLSSIAVQGTSQHGGKLVAMGDVTGINQLINKSIDQSIIYLSVVSSA